MKQRITRLVRRLRMARTNGLPGSLRARVAQLERDLDEQRANSRRIAEVLDLIETRLTPGTKAENTPEARNPST